VHRQEGEQGFDYRKKKMEKRISSRSTIKAGGVGPFVEGIGRGGGGKGVPVHWEEISARSLQKLGGLETKKKGGGSLPAKREGKKRHLHSMRVRPFSVKGGKEEKGPPRLIDRKHGASSPTKRERKGGHMYDDPSTLRKRMADFRGERVPFDREGTVEGKRLPTSSMKRKGGRGGGAASLLGKACEKTDR